MLAWDYEKTNDCLPSAVIPQPDRCLKTLLASCGGWTGVCVEKLPTGRGSEPGPRNPQPNSGNHQNDMQP